MYGCLFYQERGNNLLIQAAMLGKEDIVVLLLDREADIEAKNSVCYCRLVDAISYIQYTVIYFYRIVVFIVCTKMRCHVQLLDTIRSCVHN